MTGEKGYSVIELLVASAILLVVSGAVLAQLHDGLAAAPVLEETTDLHQRARVAADVIAADLRASAAGPPSGPLSRYFAAVDPRRPGDPPGTASPSAVTLRYAAARGAHSRLAQPLAPAMALAVIDGAGCPAGAIACGFLAGTMAIVFDASGHADLVRIEAIGPGLLTITDPMASRATAYPAGSEIVEATQVTYFHDAVARQLYREEGGGSFVVADNLTALTFEYLGDAMTPLPLSLFEDGPFGGAGAAAFDLDLLRVNSVRVRLRLDTGVDRLRGTDPRLFARPGTATGRRFVPDLMSRFEVSLRNVGR